MDFTVAQHCVEALQSLGCLGKEADTADRTVEPVGNSHIDFARFAVPPGYVGLESFSQALVSGFVSLHYFAHLLVDCKQVVVFKKNPGL